MTELVMNGQARDCFLERKRLLAGCTVAVLALWLSGCATASGRLPLSQIPVDPRSPAAPAIQAVVDLPQQNPSFAAIPVPPGDVSSTAQLKAVVTAEKAAGRDLAEAVAPDTWMLQDTDSFAARAVADANASGLHPPTAAEIAESEAFAKAMRARAKPPSRPR